MSREIISHFCFKMITLLLCGLGYVKSKSNRTGRNYSSSDGRKCCRHGSGYAENGVLNLVILSDGGAVGAKG